MATLVIDTYNFIDKLKASGMASTKQDVQVAVAELKADLFKWFIPLMLGQYGLLVAMLMKLH